VRYRFSTPFKASAERAYAWCTDYRPDDIARMGMSGKRRIERINDDTLLLTDVFDTGSEKVTKKKMVRLNPERLSWTSTYLNGALKYSQFLYEVVPTGEGRSKLNFTGLQVFWGPSPNAEGSAEIRRRLTMEDSADWRVLADALNSDLKSEPPTVGQRGFPSFRYCVSTVGSVKWASMKPRALAYPSTLLFSLTRP